MKWLVGLLIWFSIFLFRFWQGYQEEVKLGQMTGEEIRTIGRISSEPLLQGISQKFKIGLLSVMTKTYPSFDYGQKVVVSGILQRRVISKWHSQFSLMYPSIETVPADNVYFIGLIKLREKIEMVFDLTLPEPEASLLAGIVLGSKRGLPQDFWQSLQKTSTLHIVVASGYNVTIIMATIVAYLAGWVKRKQAIFIGILAVAAYTIMAGAEPAIVRAAIMGSLVFFSQITGRKSEGLRLLLGAVMIMLVIKPMYVFDLGFQLSAAATGGLLFFGPKLDKWLGKVWLIGKDLAETTAAQIAVWPIIWFNFGQMSLFGILVNSLILWLVPIIMTLGALLGVVGLVYLPIARILAWFTYIPLTIMVRVIQGFGKIL